MSNFKGAYLRVLTPITNDGTNPLYDEDRQPRYKESHLPLSARKHLERNNNRRPNQIKHIIEEVGEVKPAESPKPSKKK